MHSCSPKTCKLFREKAVNLVRSFSDIKKNQRLYSWVTRIRILTQKGDKRDGKIGNGSIFSGIEAYPFEIEYLKGMRWNKISCGHYHSI